MFLSVLFYSVVDGKSEEEGQERSDKVFPLFGAGQGICILDQLVLVKDKAGS